MSDGEKSMEINGWKYDYESLDGWDARDKNPWYSDKLMSNSNSDTACLIYSVREVRMCTEMGYLAIFKYKDDPKLMINVISMMFPVQEPFYSNDGRYIILKAQIYMKETDRIECPILFLDVIDMKFANFEMKGNNYTYQFEQLAPWKFLVKVDDYQKTESYAANTIVNLEDLVWLPFFI